MPPHLIFHLSKVASVLAARRPSSHRAHAPDNLLEFWRRRPAQTKSAVQELAGEITSYLPISLFTFIKACAHPTLISSL